MISYFNHAEVLDNLNTACPMKECYVYKNMTSYQQRYGNPQCTIPGEKRNQRIF